MRRLLPCFALLLAACGMTKSAYTDKVRARHAGEFGCSGDGVKVSALEYSGNRLAGTFAADGCGQRSIYVCDNGNCLRNSEAR